MKIVFCYLAIKTGSAFQKLDLLEYYLHQFKSVDKFFNSHKPSSAEVWEWLTFSKPMALTCCASSLTDSQVRVKLFAVQGSAHLSMRRGYSLNSITILHDDPSTGALIRALWFAFEGVLFVWDFVSFALILIILCASKGMGHKLHVLNRVWSIFIY